MNNSPQTVVFQNGTVILPERTIEDGVVVCRQGRVQAVGKQGRVSIPSDATMVNANKGGADFMDGTPEAVRIVTGAHGSYWHMRK